MSIEKRLEKIEKQNELIISLLKKEATGLRTPTEEDNTSSDLNLKLKDLKIELREQLFQQ
jgi:hypothetical protein